MNEREIFLNAAIAAGCPEDQTRNFVAAKLWLQERQLTASAVARLCDRPDGPTAIGNGGARGGGKSHWMLSQLGADAVMVMATPMSWTNTRSGFGCRNGMPRRSRRCSPGT